MINKILISITFLTQSLLAVSVNISYNYDNINRLTAVSYATGQAINYTYDEAGNITKVSTSNSSVDCNDNDPLTIDIYSDGSCQNISDVDGDGVADTDDSNNNDGPYGDYDSDGQLNKDDSDDDNDGMPDVYEDANGMNSQNAIDAGEDFDGDGFTNLQEYRAGSNPSDSTDTPKVSNPAIIMYLLD